MTVCKWNWIEIFLKTGFHFFFVFVWNFFNWDIIIVKLTVCDKMTVMSPRNIHHHIQSAGPHTSYLVVHTRSHLNRNAVAFLHHCFPRSNMLLWMWWRLGHSTCKTGLRLPCRFFETSKLCSKFYENRNFFFTCSKKSCFYRFL